MPRLPANVDRMPTDARCPYRAYDGAGHVYRVRKERARGGQVYWTASPAPHMPVGLPFPSAPTLTALARKVAAACTL